MTVWLMPCTVSQFLKAPMASMSSHAFRRYNNPLQFLAPLPSSGRSRVEIQLALSQPRQTLELEGAELEADDADPMVCGGKLQSPRRPASHAFVHNVSLTLPLNLYSMGCQTLRSPTSSTWRRGGTSTCGTGYRWVPGPPRLSRLRLRPIHTTFSNLFFNPHLSPPGVFCRSQWQRASAGGRRQRWRDAKVCQKAGRGPGAGRRPFGGRAGKICARHF